MTTGDGSIPGDGLDDLDEDLTDDVTDGLDEDLIERLRRADPVDVDALPSSRGAEAMRTLDEILGPDDEAESRSKSEAVTRTEESSPSPAAVGRCGEDAPPPFPTSR